VSFVLGEFAATYVDIGIESFILVPFFVVLLCMIAVKLKRFRSVCIYAFLGVFIFVISFLNTKEYSISVNEWEKKKENSRVIISGYVDDIIEKENVIYIYVDDIFIQADYDVYCDLYVGNYIEVKGIVKHFEIAHNEGNFDAKSYYNSMGFTKKIEAVDIKIVDDKRDRLRELVGWLKMKYIAATYEIWDSDTAPIICAITVGNKDNLSDEVKEEYRVIGISHILAISGLHLSIIGMGIFKLLRKRFRYLMSGAISIIAIFLFGVCIGDSASIKRATIMFVMHIIAMILGRTYDIISATSFSALVLLWDCPYIIYNSGFLMSFGAIIAICAIGNIIEKPNILSVTGFIQCITLPLTMMFFYEVPLYSLIVNLLVIPTVGILVVSGLLSGILGMFSLGIGSFISGIGKLILWLYEKLYDIVSSFSCNNIVTGKPQLWLMVIFYVFIIGVMFIVYWKKSQLYMLLIIPIVLLFLYGNKDKAFYISFLDVGQGDCILIHNEDSSVYMIDAGSSDVRSLYKYRIESTLKAKGIEKIDGFIVTHADTDHISAVKDIIEDGVLNKLYLPSLNSKDEKYLELVNFASEHNVEVKYLYAGMKLEDGGMELKCLYPFINSESMDVNELSTVIKVEYDDTSILCMGDLGTEGENKLISRYSEAELKCDILKVGHHGSKNSSCIDFLRIVSPCVSVISCGEDNSYGHPHLETLERLKGVSSKIMMTKDYGEVRMKVDERSIYIAESY